MKQEILKLLTKDDKRLLKELKYELENIKLHLLMSSCEVSVLLEEKIIETLKKYSSRNSCLTTIIKLITQNSYYFQIFFDHAFNLISNFNIIVTTELNKLNWNNTTGKVITVTTDPFSDLADLFDSLNKDEDDEITLDLSDESNSEEKQCRNHEYIDMFITRCCKHCGKEEEKK